MSPLSRKIPGRYIPSGILRLLALRPCREPFCKARIRCWRWHVETFDCPTCGRTLTEFHPRWPHSSQAAAAVWGSASSVQRETGLHIHPAATARPTCVCGEVPWEPNLRSLVTHGVVHRAGGPCYVEDAAAQTATGRYRMDTETRIEP